MGLAALPLLFALVFLAMPVARLLLEGLWGEPVPGLVLADTGPWWRDAHLQWRVGWTLVQAVTTCVACLMLGLPMAWVLARLDCRPLHPQHAQDERFCCLKLKEKMADGSPRS